MALVIFSVFTYIIGVLFGLRLIRDPKKLSIMIFSGFLWGNLLLVVASLLLPVLQLAFNRTNFLVLCLMTFLLLLVSNFRKQRFSWLKGDHAAQIIGMGMLHLALSLLFMRHNYVYLTSDSHVVVITSRNLIGVKDLFYFLRVLFYSSFYLLSIVTQTFGFFMHEPYNWALPINIFGSFVPTLFFFIYRSSLEIKKYRVVFWLASALLSLLLIFTPIFQIISRYIIAQNLSTAYLVVALIFYVFGIREKNEEWFFLGNLLLIGFYFSRVESPYFIVLLLVSILPFQKYIQLKAKLLLIAPLVSVVFLQELLQGIAVYTLPGTPDVTSVHPAFRNWVAIACMVGLVAGYLLVEIKFLKKRLNHINAAIIFAFIAFWIFLLRADIHSHQLITSIISFALNVNRLGKFSSTVVIFSVLFFLAYFLDAAEEEDFSKKWILIYLLLTLSLGAVRTEGYRIYVGDSGNRIFFQIFPFIFVYLIMKIKTSLQVSMVSAEAE